MKVRVVGIDCATVEAKTGLAFGVFDGESLRVLEANVCSKQAPVVASVVAWIRGGVGPVLVALDAPLGWPERMGSVLGAHRAGLAVSVPSNELFRRETDRFIQRTFGNTPLDVGADRIARTAHAGLRILEELRRELDVSLELAWLGEEWDGVRVIEVYPAATLVSHGLRSAKYKKDVDLREREEMVTCVSAHISLPVDKSKLSKNADALDASICLLAAQDFLRGRALPPADRVVAEREGWIWVAEPNT